MTDGQYLRGIDLGTGGARAGIFDVHGYPKAASSTEWETRFPRTGRAEQNPQDWWDGAVRAVRQAVADSGLAPEQIAGISLDATSATVVAMDNNGEHLRPAILWMDVRAADQAERVRQTGAAALKYAGSGPVSAEWGLPKAMWLRENEKETWDSAAVVTDCTDWMVKKLTGEWTMSLNHAAGKYFHDNSVGGWPEELYSKLGAEEILAKYPQRVLPIGEVVGGLTAAAAEALGLKEGTPVAEGAIDAHAGAIGLGVVAPGTMALITGSSHVIIAQSDVPLHAEGIWGAYTDALVKGQYTVEAGQASTGSIVAWYKNQFAKEAGARAAEQGVDPYDILNEMATDIPIGSDGLVFMDYFQGNRTPHSDPHVRGAVHGLGLGHTEAHIYRSILEGVAYGTEDILRVMRANGFDPQTTVVSGGAAHSEVWMQIHADVANMPMQFTEVQEGPTLGSAMLAAIGAGIYPDLQSAAENMVHVTDVLEPNPEAVEAYRFYTDRYLETYPALKEVMHKVTAHENAKE